MKTNLFIFLLLFSGINCIAQSGKPQYCAIAFYNTENLFDPANDPRKEDDDFTPGGSYRYTQNIYQKKLYNIATVLAQLGKDKAPEGASIIGLAEIENSKVLANLVAQTPIKQTGYKYIWYDSPDPRGIDVALLYNAKTFRPLRSKPVAINMPGKATRDILYVHGVLQGDTVHILVNHWPSRREGKEETAWERETAAKTNRRIIDSILHIKPKAKIIVMGDLNDDPADKSVAGILNTNGNATMLKPGTLYNPWLDIHRSGRGTLQYKRQWNLFDQILCSGTIVSGNGKWKYHSATIFDKGFLQQQKGKFKGSPYRSFRGTYWMNGYSDHYPVVMYLQKH